MKGICKHYGEEFDCCKLLSDFSNPMPDLRPCTKDEHECEYYKPRTNFDRITSSVENLAENLVESVNMELVGLRHKAGDGKLCATWEEAVQRTIEWLQKEADDGI